MEYTIEIGVFAPELKEQLNSQNVYMKTADYEKYEKIKKSIHMLSFHDILTKSQIDMAWKKFYKNITKDIYDDISIENM